MLKNEEYVFVSIALRLIIYESFNATQPNQSISTHTKENYKTPYVVRYISNKEVMLRVSRLPAFVIPERRFARRIANGHQTLFAHHHEDVF